MDYTNLDNKVVEHVCKKELPGMNQALTLMEGSRSVCRQSTPPVSLVTELNTSCHC